MEAIVFSSDRTLSTLVGALDAYRDPLRMFLNVDGAPAVSAPITFNSQIID
jgi:hypothetical protein